MGRIASILLVTTIGVLASWQAHASAIAPKFQSRCELSPAVVDQSTPGELNALRRSSRTPPELLRRGDSALASQAGQADPLLHARAMPLRLRRALHTFDGLIAQPRGPPTP